MSKKRIAKRDMKRVRKYVDKWIGPLGLLWWHTDIRYTVDRKLIKKRFTNKEAHTEAVAIVYADWRYMKADIYVNMITVKRLDEYELEKAIVHEFMHILVNEMRAGGIDHEERVVTGLANAALWLEAEFKK